METRHSRSLIQTILRRLTAVPTRDGGYSSDENHWVGRALPQNDPRRVPPPAHRLKTPPSRARYEIGGRLQ